MKRLHPRIQFVWALRSLVLAALAAIPTYAGYAFFGLSQYVAAAIPGAVLLLGIVFAVARYRRWGYEIREDDIYLERGVITQVRTVVPLVRIQHVDSRRGPIERATGLASCVVYTAGSRGADVRIPGLTPENADQLRERLKRLAIRAEGEDAV